MADSEGHQKFIAMSIPRLEYRDLELPKVEQKRAGRGWVSRTSWALFVLGALAVAYAGWRGELSPGFVYAREWVSQHVGAAGKNSVAPAADPSRLMLHTVQPLDLRITAVESGTLESASSATVLSQVEGEAAILKLVPEGTRVNAGDVVVELDSSSLRARLTEQQIVVEKARASCGQTEQSNKIAASQAEGDIAAAELLVEFARLDLDKYEKGDYPLELRTLQTDTALAEEELERAKVQVQFSEDLAKDGYIHQGELDADRFRVKQAQYKLENGRDKERSLQDYTYPRTKRDLESKVQEAERALGRVRTQAQLAAQTAATSLKAQQRTLELEEAKLAHVEDQLASCAMRAPQAGMVIYPVPPDADMVELFIKQGTTIKERQHVFSIPDTDVLQISTSVHEALVNRIHPALPALIKIDVYPGLELAGSVEWVSPTPEAGDWRRTTVKFYETKVRIEGKADGLRPGMSARVEILIEDLPDTLAVPVQAVVQRGSNGVCYVFTDRPELRRVKLGKSSSEYIAVLEGLTAGERVVLSPDVLGIPPDAFGETPADAQATAARGSVAAPEADVATKPVVQELEYEAELAGVPVTSAMAEFKIKTKDAVPAYKFKTKIAGGPAGATYEIRVDGVVVGSVSLDDTGSCALELSTKLGNFPPTFPLQAGPGSVVALGDDLKGTLALVPNNP